MTEKEIEQIKMVAKFMEINVCLFEWRGIKSIVRCDKSGDINLNDDLEFYSPDTSWKDLMDVVEKIISLGWQFQLNSYGVSNDAKFISSENSIQNVAWSTPLLATYNVVIDFIKFYNQNKQS
jgi:hypothetical protein